MLSSTGCKLLIVDDLPENLLALEALIRRDGREVFKAQCADDALVLLLEHEFALAILDVQMPGMNGFELAELMRGTEKTKHIPIVFVSAAGREMNYAFKGYESGAVDFLYKPLDIQAVQSKVAVFVDLYRQRKVMTRQLEALEQARKEQDALLGELRATQGELQHAVRMRDDFMSIVSHELRTPLNGLILDTQLRKMHLSRGNMAAFSDDKLKAMFDRDERQIHSLIRLIEDMLDVSRIRTGKLSIRPVDFDLAQTVRNVAENFAQQMEVAGCELQLDCDEVLCGSWDQFRVEQVISNLLSNALRYGAGRPIEVRARAEDDGVRIDVRDHGIGISLENQRRIFQQFERAVSSESVAGLGLGLFISEQIVKAHGGSIEVQSSLGQGSLFSLWLPRGKHADMDCAHSAGKVEAKE
ncbi:hybrid sensor histidine kinase/response regulator [Pseudomonas daroniae]|uniref:histidine kinase n=1 Tax=Phytopseudomonas daroniae TaxID=2487519 RepID=A0A4Q9QN40_9GAMM|nr:MULTISPECIES: hybrid sensor histidine kinase/response regulator [Pseudomonas]TBU78885.1 hybrid sensor histidine kinase/response regulator [Pseudomonas daroniae]TBU81211.1 hybrid sensor histidine kinase/response regulator [Pseudomonas daroniae]TBU83735.1 hybrid sensor histidine kinase/response regulator [Pseudomonas sp. FRB 228]TBU89330.1 hybrid sensor histidine kinase/response regulator [Pseudomonas daroniae]